MTQSRDFGPEAAKLREALERYSRDELMDLMTHILRVYVLNGATPLNPELHQPSAPEDLARLSFPQLLLHLQMALDLNELERFRVSGSTVFVQIGDKEFRLDGPTPLLPEEVEALRNQAREEVPAPAPAPAAAPRSPLEEELAADAQEEAPKSGSSRFDIGNFDFGDDHPEPEPKPRRKPAARPRPEPVSRGGGGGGSTQRGGGSLFGGSSNDRNVPNIPLYPDAPGPPPPIAAHAPGDPSPEERAKMPSAPDAPQGEEEVGRRPGFEEPPALAEGDKQINPSNRFASLELD